jgi:hypothetical protein
LELCYFFITGTSPDSTGIRRINSLSLQKDTDTTDEENLMSRILRPLTAALTIVLLAAQPAFAAPNADDAFRRLWERQDRPVAEQTSGRSWTWGPAPISGQLQEDFSAYPQPPLPDGKRIVQYFDKGRMEISDPNADPASPWFVTSGLLPVELMTGRMQMGFESFARWRESYVTAIGDPGSFPTYPDLLPLYQNPGKLDPDRLGKPVTGFRNPDERISAFTAYSNDPATILRPGPNNHGIPQAFLDFQTQHGPVYEDGRFVERQIYDPLFVFGLPITPAVWVRAKVGGVDQPVLFQVFERRVLTYNPANPLAFRVEMGNVGQHYYQWRYQPETAKEWGSWDWNTQTVQSQADPRAVYVLEVQWHDTNPAPAPPQRKGRYTIYFSADGGTTREARYTGEVGGCNYSNVALLPPRDPQAAVGRIGLATQCADNPSESRGAGVTIMTSFDGARTFLVRGSF